MKNMKKILALLMTGAMVVGFASCGKSDDKKATENNDKNLVVGFDQNFPPFGYVGEDGEFTGFDIELAAAAGSFVSILYVLISLVLKLYISPLTGMQRIWNFPPVPSTVSGTDSPLTDVKMITPGQILT